MMARLRTTHHDIPSLNTCGGSLTLEHAKLRSENLNAPSYRKESHTVACSCSMERGLHTHNDEPYIQLRGGFPAPLSVADHLHAKVKWEERISRICICSEGA